MDEDHIPNSKYPFDQWLNGQVWVLRNQLDFTCLAMSLQSMVYTHARARGLHVCTMLIGWDGSNAQAILVQAYPFESTWKPNLGNVPWTKIKKAMDNRR